MIEASLVATRLSSEGNPIKWVPLRIREMHDPSDNTLLATHISPVRGYHQEYLSSPTYSRYNPIYGLNLSFLGEEDMKIGSEIVREAVEEREIFSCEENGQRVIYGIPFEKDFVEISYSSSDHPSFAPISASLNIVSFPLKSLWLKGILGGITIIGLSYGKVISPNSIRGVKQIQKIFDNFEEWEVRCENNPRKDFSQINLLTQDFYPSLRH